MVNLMVRISLRGTKHNIPQPHEKPEAQMSILVVLLLGPQEPRVLLVLIE